MEQYSMKQKIFFIYNTMKIMILIIIFLYLNFKMQKLKTSYLLFMPKITTIILKYIHLKCFFYR